MTKKIVLTIIVALVIAASGFSATTGDLILSGTVSGVLDILITPDANATALDLTTDATNLIVASVNEQSNSATGYTVTVTSLNGGAVAGGLLTGPGADTVIYTLTYDSVDKPMVSGFGTLTDTTGVTPALGVDKDLEITYTGVPTIQAGAYSDTLTLTIAIK